MLHHRFSSIPIVDTIVVNGRTIDIRCAGDYEAFKQRIWASAKSLPVNVASLQGSEHTNADVAGRGVVVDVHIHGGAAPVLDAMHEGGAK